MNVTRTSILTGTTQTLYIEGLTQDMLDSYHDGELIQNALAGIAIELREFVMTGISPAEWAEKLPENDDDPHPGEDMLSWDNDGDGYHIEEGEDVWSNLARSKQAMELLSVLFAGQKPTTEEN
jgi:hypothetical protein